MGLIERMRKRITANLNEMIARARDPERALTRLVAEIDDDLEMVKQTAVVAEERERQLRDELADHELQAERMKKKALLAAERGKDELAREALKRRHMHQRLADDIRSQWETEKQCVDLLRIHIEGLQLKRDEAERKKELVAARERLKKLQQDVQESTWQSRDRPEDATIGRIEDDVDDIEAKAEAAAAVAADFLETRLGRLGGQSLGLDAEIEAELERIKRRVSEAREPDSGK